MKNEMDIEKSIEEFQEVAELVCSKSFRTQRASRKGLSKKAVPWWTGTDNNEENVKLVETRVPKDKKQ